MTAALLVLALVAYLLSALTAWTIAEAVCCRRHRPAPASPLLRPGDPARPAGRPTRHRQLGDPPPA